VTQIQSFPPVENPTARILILGSIPGKESLQAGQYYAHPRNAFWPIMGKLVGAEPTLPYEARLQKLRSSNIALWDVLASCRRHTSLDADIESDSISANDFVRFFKKHPKVELVVFNGSMAEHCFRKYVWTSLETLIEKHQMRFQRLPSTSPANASMRFEMKLKIWKEILQSLPADHTK